MLKLFEEKIKMTKYFSQVDSPCAYPICGVFALPLTGLLALGFRKSYHEKYVHNEEIELIL